MALDQDIKVRVDDDFKARLEEEAKDLGLNLSSYIRFTLTKEIKRIDEK